MAGLMYHLFSSTSLLSLGLFHLVSSARSHLKSPQSYSARPYHPLPFNDHHHRPFVRNLQLYLLVFFLLVAAAIHAVSSSTYDPLLKGHSAVHRFTSLHSSAISGTRRCLLRSDLMRPVHGTRGFTEETSDLEAKCDSLSSLISALSSLLCLALAVNPKLFVADLGLGASVCLQGLWVLQTGLSLYVEAFIPEGCHRLLDVAKGVEGSTKCDLEESKLRATAILDLVFTIHVMFVVIIVLVIYAAVAKSVGVRRLGSYEPLPTIVDRDRETNSHIQMKSLTGTQA
ncbi:hypothetical protein CRG98_027093 [Punica granatum]|uniref:Uncharacterized protein n=1 Tax=Punica granatum TaxID=22663 RepID=A0A2I0J8E4_PUNGR|nr:hypothetical protein CRG98_027093 [Punica granatum]